MILKAQRLAKWFMIAAIIVAAASLVLLFLFSDLTGFLAFVGFTVAVPVMIGGAVVSLAVASAGRVYAAETTWAGRLWINAAWVAAAILLPRVPELFATGVMSVNSPPAPVAHIISMAMLILLVLGTLITAVTTALRIARAAPGENLRPAALVAAGLTLIVFATLGFQGVRMSQYQWETRLVEYWQTREFETERDGSLARAAVCFSIADAHLLLDRIDDFAARELRDPTDGAPAEIDTATARSDLSGFDTDYCEADARAAQTLVEDHPVPDLAWHGLYRHPELDDYLDHNRPPAPEPLSIFTVTGDSVRSSRELAQTAEESSNLAGEEYREERRGTNRQGHDLAEGVLAETQTQLAEAASRSGERLISEAGIAGTPEAKELIYAAEDISRAKPEDLRTTLAAYAGLAAGINSGR